MSGSFPASKGLPARIGCGQGDEVIRYEAMRAWLGAGYVQNLPRQSPISSLRVGVTTIRRAELANGKTSMTAANDLAVRRALEAAGVEFIDENGGGPGVRLRKRQQPK
jgi:hypothetical protein